MVGADPTIDSRRGAAHRAFLGVLTDVVWAGGVVPCLSHEVARLSWLSADVAEQESAARACRRCPVLADCWRYQNEHPERAGTWAGLTETERKARR